MHPTNLVYIFIRVWLCYKVNLVYDHDYERTHSTTLVTETGHVQEEL